MTVPQRSPSLPASLPSVVRTLTQEKICRYGQATGDLNPVHIDPQAAATTRFGGTIAHGMLVLAYISEAMTAGLGEHWLRSGRLRVKFRAVGRPGDTVAATGRLKGIRQAGEVCHATYAVEAHNQQGDLLVDGEAEVAVPLEGR